jgi:hypothetical protein
MGIKVMGMDRWTRTVQKERIQMRYSKAFILRCRGSESDEIYRVRQRCGREAGHCFSAIDKYAVWRYSDLDLT